MPQRPLTVLFVEHESKEPDGLRTSLDGLRKPGFELCRVGELAEGLERLSRGGVDVVLLDPELPDATGMAAFERMSAFAPELPILVAGGQDEEMAISMVQGGAQEYLVRDEVTPRSLARSLRCSVERKRLLSATRRLSLIDDLTGLYNRQGFLDLGDRYTELAARNDRSVAVVALDLDRFTTINRTLGHHIGDRALVRVAEILRGTFRRSDVVARLEGDDFAAFCLEAGSEDPLILMDRVREGLAAFNGTDREPYRLAATLGVAISGGPPVRLERLLLEAQESVAEQKRRKMVGA